jgi:hypothetical protein
MFQKTLVKQTLVNELKRYLALYPKEAPEFLSHIQEALEYYEKAVEEARNVESQNAIRNMIGYLNDSTLFNSVEDEHQILVMMDALYNQFPKGNFDDGAPVERRVAMSLQEKMKKLNNYPLDDPDWVVNTRGSLFLDWLNKLINWDFKKEE